MSRITKTQLVNLTKNIDELAHKLNFIEKNETIILDMNSPGDRFGTRYKLIVRNSDLHTESAFLTDRLCLGSQEAYSMLYPLWLLLCKLVDQRNTELQEMQQIYNNNKDIFLGDLDSYFDITTTREAST